MNDTLRIYAKGEVQIECGGNTIYMQNAVLELSKQIMAGRLADTKNSIIDYIRIYRNNALIASAKIYDTTLSDLSQVSYSAMFSPGSFTGSFDKVTLNCSNLGDFSEISGFNAIKDADVPLAITWKIKII